jgi:4'-phosphopantetheinyl transferase EntD
MATMSPPDRTACRAARNFSIGTTEGPRPSGRAKDLVGVVLDMILPAEVKSAECFGEAFGWALFPEEEKIVARAVESRRREYAAVRSCARACLGRLGYARVPILPSVGGAPTWPAGVQGSMTHCAGYAAAAVGPISRISAIGIDAEPDAALPDGVLDLVATPTERDRLAVRQLGPDSPNWDRLLFSAKEAVYKAWFPLTGEWLDHEEVEILFDPQQGTFAALLPRAGLIVHGRQVRCLPGRWARKRGILVTAVVLGST